MAAPYNPPIKGQDFVFRFSLADLATAGSFKANPTLAAGDFKVDIDGGGFNNLNTLPTVDPAGGVMVKAILSTTEMNGDVISFTAIDQTTTKEWADLSLCILTTT